MPETLIGFVYLWMDNGRRSERRPGMRRFCLGSHCGTEDDGYLTSTGSGHFHNAYKRRPEDFRRRIIERIYESSQKTVREAEQRWLNMIKVEELNERYYNRKKSAEGFDKESRALLTIFDPTYNSRVSATLRATITNMTDEEKRLRYQNTGIGIRKAHKNDPTLGPRIGAAISNTYATDPTYRERLTAAVLKSYENDPTRKIRQGDAIRAAKAKISPEQKRESDNQGWVTRHKRYGKSGCRTDHRK